jgi:hypothetical protein
MNNEPYGYVWTSIKDGMETRFTRMYPNDFYKPTDITPVYKSQQRTWVGLTDDEIYQVMQDRTWMHTEGLCRAIEAKLKEKNT